MTIIRMWNPLCTSIPISFTSLILSLASSDVSEHISQQIIDDLVIDPSPLIFDEKVIFNVHDEMIPNDDVTLYWSCLIEFQRAAILLNLLSSGIILQEIKLIH